MDTARFDRIARLLGSRAGRRSILGLLAALGAGGLLGLAPEAEAKQGKKKPKPKPKKCGECKRRVKGTCKPKKNGSACRGGTCQRGRCRAGGGGCVPNRRPGANFTVSGRQILDPSGKPALLRGVNRMFLYFQEEANGPTLSEIAKTGANSVRIVWGIKDDNGRNTDVNVLDALIANAKANGLVPMIELHDATGDQWPRLGELVAYWTRPEVVRVITKHQESLLVNIANEISLNDANGNNLISDEEFVKGYTDAARRMRCAGIHTPLVIDALDWGKDLGVLTRTAGALLDADPDHNLIFSVHMYWGIAVGATPQYIKDQLDAAQAANFALVIGEFSQWGAWNPDGGSMCEGKGEVDFRTILQETAQRSIGWYAWEWGPGNAGGGDPKCAAMDMTTDGRFATLKPGWATEVATTSPYSIRNTAQKII